MDGFQTLVEASAEEWKHSERTREVNEKWLSSKDNLISETIEAYFSDYPRSCPEFIQVRVNINGSMRTDSILNNPSTWPNWFNKIQESDAYRRTLKLMDQKFEEKVENRAQERLSQIEKEKWPVYVRNKVVPFFQKKIIDQLMTLSEKIFVQCPRCGHSYVVGLTPEEMRELISKGKTESRCGNDKCRTIFGTQTLSISFDEVLIQNGFSPYIERLTELILKKERFL